MDSVISRSVSFFFFFFFFYKNQVVGWSSSVGTTGGPFLFPSPRCSHALIRACVFACLSQPSGRWVAPLSILKISRVVVHVVDYQRDQARCVDFRNWLDGSIERTTLTGMKSKTITLHPTAPPGSSLFIIETNRWFVIQKLHVSFIKKTFCTFDSLVLWNGRFGENCNEKLIKFKKGTENTWVFGSSSHTSVVNLHY